MKIFEQLKQTIEKALEGLETLQEHADPKGILINLVRDKTEIIFSHLYKVYGFGELYPTTVHHWVAEIVGHFRTFVYKKYKNNNKLMPIDDIEKAMKSKFIDAQEFISIEANLLQKYGYSSHRIDVLYDLTIKSIRPIVQYLRTLDINEKPDINKVIQIMKEICLWI